jgi:hypothetical protein
VRVSNGEIINYYEREDVMKYKNANVKWFDHYSRWTNDCVHQLLMKGHKIQHNGGDVDICENGSVYFDNLAFTEPGYVTPWKESKYYIK